MGEIFTAANESAQSPTFYLTRVAGHSADGMQVGGWRLDQESLLGWTAVWAGEERSEGPVTCKAHFAAALLPHFSAKSESDSALFSCAGESNLPVYHGAACEGAWAACMCIVHWPGWKGL